MTAVELDNLALALGGRTVLSEVSAAVRDGEFIGVLGPNGAGKTTLFRAILGLVKPRAGAIRVLGRPAAHGNPAIGYMPQSRRPIGELRLRGWDLVASAVNGHRWGLPVLTRADRASVAAALETVGAREIAARRVCDLSGGERQRLLLAQALVGKPRLLLLDEPLVNLDPRYQSLVIDLVRDLHRRLGIAVLFSAHELNPLLHVLDRVLYLGHGKAALGTVEEVMTGPVLSRLYGSPIEVVRLKGRIFVMSEGQDVEHDSHRHHV